MLVGVGRQKDPPWDNCLLITDPAGWGEEHDPELLQWLGACEVEE